MVRRWWGDGKGLVRRRNGGEEDNAATLRPPRNGRIGFKPPYSKREPRRKARRGAIVYWGSSYG